MHYCGCSRSVLVQKACRDYSQPLRPDTSHTLQKYRKSDPQDQEEEEFMENAFDALCSALAEPELKKTFLESEGVELMVICMKEKKMSRSRSIKVRLLIPNVRIHSGADCQSSPL